MNFTNNISAIGLCSKCGEEHLLYEGNARKHCVDLIDALEFHNRLDFNVSAELANPKLSTDYVFGKARGQMFGVLECVDSKGEVQVLKAFSGQYNGIWEVDGWVPALLDAREFDELIKDDDKKIKALGREIEIHPHGSDEKKALVKERKNLSRKLLKDIYNLYEINNFLGEKKSLFDIFPGNGIPTGTGDCCAPKLLNFAAKNNLKPLGLAEFYFGKENLSLSKNHKEFYSSCREKCYPILGYILCGLNGNE